nr:Imm53 family immunity protein [uncultured Kingella sp.]
MQQWYQSKYNGTWEHGHGLTIATLDNPGWEVHLSGENNRMDAQPIGIMPFQAALYEDERLSERGKRLPEKWLGKWLGLLTQPTR